MNKLTKLNVQFDWTQAQAFLATAETGSFSSAAKLLGTSQPTVGRHVAALEQDLGMALFDRIGTSLTLNEKGRAVLVHIKAMQDAADLVSLTAMGTDQVIAGPISITASDAFCAYLLPPIVKRIHQQYPDLQIEIIASNDVQDLRRREADIAIRNVRPHHSNLYAKRIKTTQAHLYGSTEYLDKIGRPATLRDINPEAHFIGDSLGRVLQMMTSMTDTITPDQFKFVGNNGIVMWEMVKQGTGLAMMFKEIAQITPNVEPILEQEICPEVEAWLVTHAELKTSAKFRTVFDLLAFELKRLPLGAV